MLSQMVEASRQSRNVVGKEFYGDKDVHGFADEDHDGVCDYEA